MELALPMLTPERTLKFATLPAGDDPDSLVRKGGAPALQAVLDIARAPVDALYDMMRGDVGEATPEQRAALRSRLIEASQRIADKSLASEYRSALLGRYFATRQGPVRRDAARDTRRGSKFAASPAERRFPRAHIHQDGTASERSRILTAILLRHPFLLPEVFQAYAMLPLEPPLDRLRGAMDSWSQNSETLDSAGLMDHLTKSGLESEIRHVLAEGSMPLPACSGSDAMPAEAESGWWHIFGFLNIEHLREEVALARADADRNLTDGTERRLRALVEAFNKVRSGEPDGVGLVDA
jgi:DNA primase